MKTENDIAPGALKSIGNVILKLFTKFFFVLYVRWCRKNHIKRFVPVYLKCGIVYEKILAVQKTNV